MPVGRHPAAKLVAGVVLGSAALAGALLSSSQPAFAAGACSDTARAAFNACRNEVKDDNWIAMGICENLSDSGERSECLDEASDENMESQQLCGEQRSARLDLCEELNTPAPGGDTAYDPDFSPFDESPFDNQNPFFPLKPGNKWVYEDSEGVETIIVEVLDKTKAIEGATCIVVNDLVEEDRESAEDTDDWYVHTWDGTVIYCGEISKNMVHPEGDDPAEGELDNIEGSWKWGRDGDKPGILISADPEIGDVYRQEFSLGNAEDAAEVVDDAYTYDDGADPLDQIIPQEALDAGLLDLCGAGCLVTSEFTPVEPDVEEFKIYAPGIGLILEVDPDPEEGGFVILIGCNLGAMCPAL